MSIDNQTSLHLAYNRESHRRNDAMEAAIAELELPESESLDNALLDFYTLHETDAFQMHPDQKTWEPNYAHINKRLHDAFETLELYAFEYLGKKKIPAYMYTCVLTNANFIYKINHPNEEMQDYLLSQPSPRVYKASEQIGLIFSRYGENIYRQPKGVQLHFLCLLDILLKDDINTLNQCDIIMSEYMINEDDQEYDLPIQESYEKKGNIYTLSLPQAPLQTTNDQNDGFAVEDELDTIESEIEAEDLFDDAIMRYTEIKDKYLYMLAPIANNLSGSTYLENACKNQINTIAKKLNLQMPENIEAIPKNQNPVLQHFANSLSEHAIYPEEDHNHICYTRHHNE